jgi:hypothetical protein
VLAQTEHARHNLVQVKSEQVANQNVNDEHLEPKTDTIATDDRVHISERSADAALFIGSDDSKQLNHRNRGRQGHDNLCVHGCRGVLNQHVENARAEVDQRGCDSSCARTLKQALGDQDDSEKRLSVDEKGNKQQDVVGA